MIYAYTRPRYLVSVYRTSHQWPSVFFWGFHVVSQDELSNHIIMCCFIQCILKRPYTRLSVAIAVLELENILKLF